MNAALPELPELSESVLGRLFVEARTYHGFLDRPVDDETIRQLYDLLKWGPTAMNSQPGRYLFIRSPEQKARLAPAMYPGNLDKTLAAPLTVVVAYDSDFHERMGEVFPPYASRPVFHDTPAIVEPTARLSSALQGAYLIIAARALGLAAGPMTGFDAQRVNQEFFPDGRYRTFLLTNLGYGDPAAVRPRAPRFAFDDVAQIL